MKHNKKIITLTILSALSSSCAYADGIFINDTNPTYSQPGDYTYQPKDHIDYVYDGFNHDTGSPFSRYFDYYLKTSGKGYNLIIPNGDMSFKYTSALNVNYASPIFVENNSALNIKGGTYNYTLAIDEKEMNSLASTRAATVFVNNANLTINDANMSVRQENVSQASSYYNASAVIVHNNSQATIKSTNIDSDISLFTVRGGGNTLNIDSVNAKYGKTALTIDERLIFDQDPQDKNNNIYITNSNLIAKGQEIDRSKVAIASYSTTDNNIYIKNSTIFGDYLINTQNNNMKVEASDHSKLLGHISIKNDEDETDDLTNLDLSLDDSTWTGNVRAYSTGNDAKLNKTVGTFNLSLSGADSHWQMLNSSIVTSLKLSDGAAVSLGRQDLAVTDTNKVTLAVDDLSGSGIFNLRTNMSPAVLVGDSLEIRNNSAGSHQLVFTDSKTGSYKGDEELKVVSFTGKDQAANKAVFTSKGADVGPYIYGLSQYADGNWYLSSPVSPKPVDPDKPVNPDKPVEPDVPNVPNPPLTNTAQNSVNFLNVNYYLGFIDNQTLLQRMGELRQSPQKDGDFWLRTYGGVFTHFSGERLSGFDLNYWGIQAGIDRRIELNNSSSDLFVGVTGGYTKADIDFKVGDGTAKHYNIGAYLSYKKQNGFYIDALAKYLHAKNDFSTMTINNLQVNGDGSMDGYSLGAEVGQRFYKDTATKYGFYIEPQGQLTWTHMGSGTIDSDNDLKTKLGSYDSLVGRASAIFGYSLVKNNNPIDLYFKTGYLKEFKGDTDYTFNNTFKEKYSFNSGWWDNGIGVNMQFDKNKTLYMDANYALGGKFDSWKINAGYRQQF